MAKKDAFWKVDAASGRISEALMTNQEAAVNRLLHLGADVNETTEEVQSTPLMIAATTNNAGLVELLLSRGADPTLVNAGGKRAWEIAEMAGSLSSATWPG